MPVLTCSIADQAAESPEDAENSELRVEIHTGSVVELMVKGYGNCAMIPGAGAIAALELYEGRLRLLVWDDINNEDPLHIIDLEGAREERRKS